MTGTDSAQSSVDLEAEVQRLRKRTHEIQEAADKRIAALSKTVEHWRSSLALADSYLEESGVVFHSSVTRAKAASLFQQIATLQAQLADQTEETDTWQMAFEECRELRSIAEAQVAEMQPELGKLKTDLEHTRQLVAAQEAETTRLRLVLVQIQDWDCLNPPDPRMCADHPWLRRLVDNTLSTRLDAADVPAASTGKNE